MTEKDEYIELREQIYIEKIDLTGRVLKSGARIGKIIVDGRDKQDTIIYEGTENNIPVIIKYIYDHNDIINGIKYMEKLKSLGIDLYYYHIDHLLDYDEDSDNFLIMEKLLPVEKDDVFEMLTQLLPVIFKYKDYMTHCDIKPENIMKSITGKFYLIDYDNICNKKFLYGYKRETFTPKFATQSTIYSPVLITIKQDIIELILSAHAIFYRFDPRLGDKNEIKENDTVLYLTYSTSNIRYIYKRIFAALYIIALNMNDKYITDKDLYLLLITLQAIANNNNPKLIDKILTAIEKGIENKDITITSEDLIPPQYTDDNDI